MDLNVLSLLRITIHKVHNHQGSKHADVTKRGPKTRSATAKNCASEISHTIFWRVSRHTRREKRQETCDHTFNSPLNIYSYQNWLYTNLTVLIRRKRARVQVNVRVDFDGRNLDTYTFQDGPERTGNYSFSNATYYTSRYQDVFHFCVAFPSRTSHF